ncbi:MAG: hypothetical protein AB1798_20790, partial [Spirochaetota bacterium]
MKRLQWNTPWFEILGLSILSFILYETGFFFFLFLIPIQILFIKRGLRFFLYAAGAVFFGIVVLSFVGTLVLKEKADFRVALTAVEIFFPLMFILGLVIVNLGKPRTGRRLYKFLLALGWAVAVSVPFLLVVITNDQISELLRRQVNLVLKLFSDSSGREGLSSQLTGNAAEAAGLVNLIRELILKNYL